MSEWWYYDKKRKQCTVCLAGACIISFYPNAVKEIIKKCKNGMYSFEYDGAYIDSELQLNGIELRNIMFSFDGLRYGSFMSALEFWYKNKKDIVNETAMEEFHSTCKRVLIENNIKMLFQCDHSKNELDQLFKFLDVVIEVAREMNL